MTEYASNSRGVAILISRDVAFRSTSVLKDAEGRYIILRGILFGKSITLMSIYCPPGHSSDFLTKAFADFMELTSEYSYVAGDFNCHIDPLLDRLPPGVGPPGKQAKSLVSIYQEIDFVDVWRTFNPSSLEFTFFSNPHKCHTRLDYFFLPIGLLNSVVSCKIGSI